MNSSEVLDAQGEIYTLLQGHADVYMKKAPSHEDALMLPPGTLQNATNRIITPYPCGHFESLGYAWKRERGDRCRSDWSVKIIPLWGGDGLNCETERLSTAYLNADCG